MDAIVELMAFVIFVGIWMFVGLLACAALLKVFSMLFGVPTLKLWHMITEYWVDRVNKWGGGSRGTKN